MRDTVVDNLTIESASVAGITVDHTIDGACWGVAASFRAKALTFDLHHPDGLIVRYTLHNVTITASGDDVTMLKT